MTPRVVEVTIERSETQKIGSYGGEHREGPTFGRIPDDDAYLDTQSVLNKHFTNLLQMLQCTSTKQWLQVEVGNEIVMHFLLSLISSLDFKQLFVPIDTFRVCFNRHEQRHEIEAGYDNRKCITISLSTSTWKPLVSWALKRIREESV